MKNSALVLPLLILLLIFGAPAARAQSNSVDDPTPVTSSVLNGQIRARDIGDPRSTVHYYVFEGSQGDIFLKIESNNLNGDIDIFYADNLRPVTKISLYADSTPTQTGREIYLRKAERLILRVEGRTPTDDPATYSIRFEGSFVALAARRPSGDVSKLPTVDTENDTGIRVNSVGTIIETRPKPTPTPRETVASETTRRPARTNNVPEPVSTVKTKPATAKTDSAKNNAKKQTPPKSKSNGSDNESAAAADEAKSESEVKSESVEKTSAPEKRTRTTRKATTAKAPAAKREAPPKTSKPDPAAELAKAMENVRLIVEFKDGARIERPMNEILRFGVDKGVLTIVNKNGSIGRYSILDVVRVTVE